MRRNLGVLVLASLFTCGCRGEPEPETRISSETDEGSARELVTLGCVACHAAPELAPEPAVRLADLGAFRRPAAIEAALARHEPDLLAHLSARERAASERALLQALVADGGALAEPALELDAGLIEFGRQLYHGVGCVACHQPFEQPETLARALWDFPESFQPSTAPAGAPHELAGLRARTTLAALATYLGEPLARHPSGRMPSLALDEREARALAAYLMYEDAQAEGVALTSGRGLVLEVFEGSFPGETVDYDALVPVRNEVATSFFEGVAHREDDYGFRFRGAIEVPQNGRYTFFTTSDDGSMLYVDGALVVDNRGQHGPTEVRGELTLTAGGHAFEVTYFEHMGGDGLEVDWSGPGFAQRALTFDVLAHHQLVLPERPEAFVADAGLAARGRTELETLGCLVCHGEQRSSAPVLAEIGDRGGCLSGKTAAGRPTYSVTRGELRRLGQVLARPIAPRGEVAQLADELERLDCLACHERDDSGGPSDERRSFFQVVGGLDLGDEGRLPPSLDQVGAKLKEPWLREVLVGDGRVRPYMRTRMPQFGAANVEPLVELFAKVDAPLLDAREPEFSVAAVEAGKQLVGTKGLGCIQCHTFGGHASLGIPAVDLAGVHARIQPGWFRALLMDPVALKMNTRMPAFWVDGKSPVKSLLDGDPARQVDAIWSYLSLGASMPLPHGLVPIEGEYEVEVYDVPVAVGVFMKDVSPRTICIGLPERVHYAFDVENSRLAKAWRGRFLDARGTWHARAGELEEPAGEDVIDLPPGPTFAWLQKGDEPWPTKTESLRVRYIDEKRHPRFSYRCGPAEVMETLGAELRSGGAVLKRTLGVSNKGNDQGSLFVRLAIGRSVELLERVGETLTFTVRGEREFRVRVSSKHASIVQGPLGQELRAAVDLTGTYHGDLGGLEIEYSW